MAVDRVAHRGKGAKEILAVESACGDHAAETRCHRQTALAHRARLRRTEAGTWPGTFRRQELARLSSSCNAFDRRIRLPGFGAVPFSPLNPLAATPSSQHPDSPTPCAIRLHAPRRCPCAQNGIILNPLPPFAVRSQHTSPDLCHGAHAACVDSYNTVVVENGARGLAYRPGAESLPRLPRKSGASPLCQRQW